MRSSVKALVYILLPSLFLASDGLAQTQSPAPLTVRAALETVRIISDPLASDAANPQGAVSVSPDGKRYVVRLARADVDRNGVWIEILVGSLASPSAAAQHRLAARLFTSGLDSPMEVTGPSADLVGHASSIRWIDNDRILFLSSDAQGIRQLTRVTLSTGEIELLTHHPKHVITYDISPDGLIFYNALAQRTEQSRLDVEARSLIDGTVIGDETSPTGLFHGSLIGGDALRRGFNTEWFVQRPDGSQTQIAVADRYEARDHRHRIALSPDRKTAIVNTLAGEIPQAWDQYTEPFLKSLINEARRDPSRGGLSKNVHQLYVVDLERRTSRVLWDAPNDIFLPRVAWSPDGTSVLVAPTYLPERGSDARGLSGRAAAIVEISAGKYTQLPVEIPADAVEQVGHLGWRGNDEVVIVERQGSSSREHAFRRRGAKWSSIKTAAVTKRNLRIEIHQNLNTPPSIFAVDQDTGEEQLMLDPNPDLTKRFTLGRVEAIERPLMDGVLWSGLLFYPVHYQAGRRYPLVIQATLGSPHDGSFTLYGPDGDAGMGPARIAVYPGQVLANRDIAVLHLNVLGASQHTHTPMEAEIRRQAFEAAAAHMIEAGLADRDRIGLLGFSRSGYYVEYALTHSSFPFAAAIAADNWSGSYFSAILSGQMEAAAGVNGGLPLGEGLQQWFKNAPGFNVDKVRTPLRKVVQSLGQLGVLSSWEMYSGLRRLNKPVELYLVPNYERGSHNTQNPIQVIALQQGTVDWFDFWLTGYEEPDPRKAKLYAGWRALRELQQRSSAVTPVGK